MSVYAVEQSAQKQQHKLLPLAYTISMQVKDRKLGEGVRRYLVR